MNTERLTQLEQLTAERDARERGPFHEQGTALLALIDAADPRLVALADEVANGWCAAVQRMRTSIADRGRVTAMDLLIVRSGWPIVRDRKLPPAPPRTPTPSQLRSFGEPAADHQEASP